MYSSLVTNEMKCNKEINTVESSDSLFVSYIKFQ